MQLMTLVDVLVLAVYFVVLAFLGIYLARRQQRLSEFIMPRRFGAAMMTTHSFGTGTASDQAVTVASATAMRGISGIWYVWQWLPITPLYWVIAPILRRFRAVTTADVFRLRFGDSFAVAFAIVGIASMAIKIGILLKGSAALIESGSGGMVAAEVAIPVITVLFVAYGAAGGLSAAIITDFIQGVLTLIFSFILLPFVLHAVGGFAGINETIRQSRDGVTMLSIVAPNYIGPFFICMLSLQGLIGVIAQPHVLGMCAAGRTEWDGRFGFLIGNLLKRVCTVAWCLTAIAGVAWFIQQGQTLKQVQEGEADQIYGIIAREFLPGICPGLLGVFIAALLASIMSSCDSFMISAAGLFTENIYRPWRKGQSEAHYLWTVRLVSLLVVVGGLVFAFWLDDVVQGLTIWLKLPAIMGVPLWIGIFWRRANTPGAWACVITGFGMWWLSAQGWFVGWVDQLPMDETLGLIDHSGESPKFYEPWKIFAYLFTASLACVQVSLMTNVANRDNLQRFYDLMVTPISKDEVISEPCTLPKDQGSSERRRHIWFGDFFIPIPSRTSCLGVAFGYVVVAFMVLSFLLLF